MPRPRTGPSILTRIWILVAAFSFLTGTILEPIFHPLTDDGSAALVISANADDGKSAPQLPAPHDGAACVVCQLLGGTLLAFADPLPSSPHELTVASLSPASQPGLSLRTFTLGPRAPPLR